MPVDSIHDAYDITTVNKESGLVNQMSSCECERTISQKPAAPPAAAPAFCSRRAAAPAAAATYRSQLTFLARCALRSRHADAAGADRPDRGRHRALHREPLLLHGHIRAVLQPRHRRRLHPVRGHHQPPPAPVYAPPAAHRYAPGRSLCRSRLSLSRLSRSRLSLVPSPARALSLSSARALSLALSLPHWQFITRGCPVYLSRLSSTTAASRTSSETQTNYKASSVRLFQQLSVKFPSIFCHVLRSFLCF